MLSPAVSRVVLSILFNCILFSTDDSVELAYGFANRSAVLFHLKDHDACLKDIARALKAGYPVELQYKLFDRKAKCLRALKRYQQVGDVYHNLAESLKHAKLDEAKLAQYQNEITKCSAVWAGMALKGLAMTSPDDSAAGDEQRKETRRLGANPNASFPSLSRRCEVKHSEDAGRFIAAADVIEPGEVLLVERPFASVLLPELYGTHCHVCFARCRAGVACDTCTLAVYCGEACKQLADNSFHRCVNASTVLVFCLCGFLLVQTVWLSLRHSAVL